MATRKPRTAELSAAASHLTAATAHLREAVNEKIEAFEKAAVLDLDKARQVAVAASGQASRKFDSLLKKAQKRLTKATASAKKALHRAVTKSEKQLLALDKAVQATLVKLEHVGKAKAAVAKPAAKKAPATKAVARTAPVRAAVKAKPPARKRSA